MAFAVDLPIHREHPEPLVLDWQIQNKFGATFGGFPEVLPACNEGRQATSATAFSSTSRSCEERSNQASGQQDLFYNVVEI